MSEAITFKNSEGVISLKSPVVCNACNGVDYAPCCDNGENLADQIYALEQENAALRAQEQNEPVPPKRIRRHRGSYGYVTCPDCGKEFPTSSPYEEDEEYCGKCGKLIEDASYEFCGHCGKPIAREPEHAPEKGDMT